MEENFSMEDFAAMLDQSFHKVYNGDIVEGKILEKGEKGLMVDVASYMDGVLPVEELLYDGESYDDYQVGDTVRAMVKYVDSREGQIHLSKKEADKLGIWDDLKKLQEDEQPIDVKVKRAVNGGLRVVYKTVECFLPASQISMEYVEDTSAYVGQTLTVQITEINEEKKNLIVSRTTFPVRVSPRRSVVYRLWRAFSASFFSSAFRLTIRFFFSSLISVICTVRVCPT